MKGALRITSLLLGFAFVIEISALLMSMVNYASYTMHAALVNAVFVAFLGGAVVIIFIGVFIEELRLEFPLGWIVLVIINLLFSLHFNEHSAHLEFARTYLPGVTLITLVLTLLLLIIYLQIEE